MLKRFRWALLSLGGVALLLVIAACERGEGIQISLSAPPELKGRVYIGGDITIPGYYPWRKGDTLEELIQAAGGVRGGAEPAAIKLYITPPGKEGEPQKIDINRAESWLLEMLPGIGETLAQRIIEYRRVNGYFRSLNELTRVEGIGPATFEKLKTLVTVSD